MRIKFFTTGGTIDKVYFDAKSEFEVGPPQVLEVVKEAHVNFEYDIESILRKDSLDMTPEDRDAVLGAVRERPDAPIVITHGTDTMVETGLHVKNGAGELHYPIVLTGAMSPLGFEGSDGLQNLTESFLAARILPPGVYVVMHNDVFPVEQVKKDREHAKFVRI